MKSAPSYVLTRWLFLRSLGVIFLIAFASLGSQLPGLIGEHGIWPAREYLSRIQQVMGADRFLQVPSLFWLNASDAFLIAICWLGALFSVLLTFGVTPRWTLLALWASYLSFASATPVFLSYQWDILLLETAAVALFIAPGGLHSGLGDHRAPWIGSIWLLRWLLFRLMILSGLVKLLSSDVEWWHLTALRFHYWTQPLPTALSFYVQQLPDAFQLVSCAVMFAIELAVPWLIFGARSMRIAAAIVLVSFQVLIFATGNYGFFNLLTIALCISLVDDAAILALLPASLRRRVRQEGFAPVPSRRWSRASRGTLAVLLVLVSLAEMRFWRRRLPDALEQLLGAIQPFRSINSYGLFAVMTTSRPEIILEGSLDGQTWLPYEFKWKPGRLDRGPRFVAPHQPRLDWQMWFAALGTCDRNPWFLRFQKKILEGSAEVLGLLDFNPFPSSPPRLLRSTLYQYQFTDLADWRRTGEFWKRQPEGAYCPMLMLLGGELAVPRFP